MKDLLQEVYSQIPERYELVNHILTLGLDTLWRRRAAAVAVDGAGGRWLDICAGTGEMAERLAGLAPEGTALYATDMSLPMLSLAKRKRGATRIALSISDASALPFPDRTFDLVTCSFAMRNLSMSMGHLDVVLMEVRRVLKEGGRFVSLETSRPGNPVMRALMHAFVGSFVRPIGTMLTGSRSGYAYLARSIPRFYDANELTDILLRAGFKGVGSKGLLFGAAAIHLALR